MGQILQIIRRDTQRHLPEIVFVLAVLVAFTWAEPRIWFPRDYFGADRLAEAMSSWLQTILVLGWVILIARVMHSESLVKDCQCGIAQPYEWKKLLAAKLLFIALSHQRHTC